MIFEENGFDIEIIGIERIKTAARRWKQSYDKDGLLGLQDSRSGFYNYLNSKDSLMLKEKEDLKSKELILKVLVKKDIKEALDQ